jgi:hypothetical protein
MIRGDSFMFVVRILYSLGSWRRMISLQCLRRVVCALFRASTTRTVIARVATVTLRIKATELAWSVLLRLNVHSCRLKTVLGTSKKRGKQQRRPNLLFSRVAWNARRDNAFPASALHHEYKTNGEKASKRRAENKR